jgi:hypothetical protein
MTTLDENGISVICAVDGCHARVVSDERCSEHGGKPVYEWRPSEWGDWYPSECKEGATTA